MFSFSLLDAAQNFFLARTTAFYAVPTSKPRSSAYLARRKVNQSKGERVSRIIYLSVLGDKLC